MVPERHPAKGLVDLQKPHQPPRICPKGTHQMPADAQDSVRAVSGVDGLQVGKCVQDRSVGAGQNGVADTLSEAAPNLIECIERPFLYGGLWLALLRFAAKKALKHVADHA